MEVSKPVQLLSSGVIIGNALCCTDTYKNYIATAAACGSFWS